jgi:hypothetical protein
MLARSVGRIQGFPRGDRFLALTLLVLVSVTSGCAGLTSSSAKPPTPPPTLAITISSLPAGQMGATYQVTLSASGGATPYSWSLASGSLPGGLSLNSSSGAVSGTPSASGTSSFTVQVTDSASKTAQQVLSIVVSAASGATLSVANAVLAGGQVGKLYSVTLQAAGGTPSYSWSITAGQLPAGLALGAASGQISGTPTASGQFSFTVTVKDSASSPQTASKALAIAIVASSSTLDQYGGLLAKPSPNGASGFFRVEKFGNRWMFVTPDGNAFWMLSVYHALPAFLQATVIQNKYGGNQGLWATQRNRRLQSWGFNTLGEYTSSLGLPVGVYGSVGGNSVPLPFILIMNGAVDGVDNPKSLGLPEPIKDILKGVPVSAYNNYRGPLVDAYDPKFAQAQQAEVAYWSNAITGGFADKPWVVGITTDDGDNLFGFKSRAGAPINAYPHVGFLVAVANFQYTSVQNPTGANWIDPKLYSKYAWITFLKQKYNNTISALNTAWGTGGFYTSFDDAGGYGAGTGVIDEDGRHTAWMGTMVYPYTNTGASAGVQADLDAFLYQFAKQYAQAGVTALRAVDTKHLIFGPAALNNYGAKARDQILQGISDGGVQVFQFNYNPTFGGAADLAGSMAENNQSYDLIGKPAFIWYSVTAQADSDMSGITGFALPDLPTQVQRGAQYQTVDIPAFLNAQGSNGDHYVIGLDWWELVDNPGEGVNWGLVSRLDNAYDGKEAIIAPGLDPWGFTTGGEAANYGDFLSSVTAANANLIQTLTSTLP